jgi:hypothetical protein
MDCTGAGPVTGRAGGFDGSSSQRGRARPDRGRQPGRPVGGAAPARARDRRASGRTARGTAIHSRAGHFHLRTTEILRSAGLEDTVRRKSEEQYPPDGGINNVESLAGKEIANYFPNLNAGVEEFSPTVRLFINQDALEPIIRARAEELGARLRYRTECVSLEQDPAGVTAVIRDLDSGELSSVRALYVIAADGNRSPIREQASGCTATACCRTASPSTSARRPISGRCCGTGTRACTLRVRAGFPRRRRRARGTAERRIRRQHGRSGRAQPRLETRAGADRCGRPGPA